MLLFDTMRGEVAEFDIPTERPVTLYVCGVTPYDTTHVGHARTFLIFDVLQRYLMHRGAEVRYCQNVTDVDDPLFERANRDGIAWDELARRETEQFVRDCAELHLLKPTYFPKVSEEVEAMIPIVARLVELGFGYVSAGSVYFSVAADPDYGAMARMGYDELLATANERGNNPDDPKKRDPLDFPLWIAEQPGEPSWPSPWGNGRPGWHLECTSMAMRYLGEQIDIHGGGRDLIFPHHPSEVAQTEAATGKKPFVRFWMHGGMAFLDGQKMSKSLGNMVFIRDALKEHSADAIRWYLMSFPYREDFHYERAAVVATEQQIAALQDALAASSGSGPALDASAHESAFFAALDADLAMGDALTAVAALSADIQRAAAQHADIGAAQQSLRTMARVFGFWAGEGR